MSVYLGSAGCVELRRTSLDEPYYSEIHASDINSKTNRFSFDFPAGQFLSGDLIQLTALDGEPLSFIDPEGWKDGSGTSRPIAAPLVRIDYQNGRVIFFDIRDPRAFSNADIVSDLGNKLEDDWPNAYVSPEFDPGTADYDNADVQPRSALGFETPYHDGKFFIHVDQAGGIKLYRSFDLAVSGELEGRVNLLPGDRTIPIRVDVQNNIDRVIGQITSFEVNTEREAVDVTELGDSFREQYSGLISGSGTISCLFEYERRPCDNMSNASSGSIEMPVYMNQLILRSRIGAQFFARLTVIGRGDKPGGNAVDFDDEVWYELEGIVTNVGMAFNPAQPITCTMSYVTTGEIKLKTRAISNYILEEQGTGDRLRLEEYQSGFLEQEQGE